MICPLFNKDKAQWSPIHPVSACSHIHPLSTPFSLSIHLISCIVTREKARRKADQSYIRPAEPEDTTLTPPIYDRHLNLLTRILLQVDISATLLGKVSAPEQVHYIPSAGALTPDYRWHNMMREQCDCAEKAKWQSTWVWNTKKERAMMHRGMIGKGIWNRGKGSSASLLRIEQDE